MIADRDIVLTMGLDVGDVEQNISDVREKAGNLSLQINEIFKAASSRNDLSIKFQSLMAGMDNLITKSMDLRTQMSSFESVYTPQELATNTAYKDLVAELNKVNNQMVIYLARAREAGEVNFDRPRFSLDNIAKSALNAAGAFIKWDLKTLQTGFNNANKAALKLLATAGKLVGSSIIGGFKKLGSAISNLSKHTNSANNGFEKGFKTFIKYAFGVRSFFFLFRKMRSAVVAGFGDLAQVSEPFNIAVSNILTALRLLRNSFAAAFSPIIEVVSPILTHFINQVAEAVNKIGMLIAALTGQQTYMRALPVYQDYAESLNKSSKNADKASKSTKKLKNESEKLKKTLAGFDDVEILKGPDDTGDDDDGGLGDFADALDGLSDAEQSFMRMPLGELFTNLSDLLKKAWENADFTEIGRLLGQKLKAALEKIPWADIKKVLRKIGKSIATFLNGFLEVPGLFDTIGKTIAEGLNSAFELAESFISNFHWKSLGIAIRDLILGVLNNIDWPLIYKTLAEFGTGIGETINEVLTSEELWTKLFNAAGNLFKAILQGVDNFIRSVQWGESARAIANGLNDAIANFDWSLLAQTLIDAINGIFDFWYNFVTTFDFYKFGEYIGTTLSTILNGIDWVTGSASVAETLNGLLEALNGFLATTDFGDIGHKIVEIIATFLDTFSWGEFGTFLSNCIQHILDFFIAIYTSIPWNNLATAICEKIGEFLEGFEWEPTTEKVMEFLGAAFRAVLELNKLPYMILKNVGEDIIGAIKDGIDFDLKDIGQWMFDHVLIPLVAGFLGIDEEAAAKAIEMVTGFKTGTEQHWHEVPDYINEHKAEILNPLSTSEAQREQQNVGESVDNNLKTGIENKFDEVPELVQQHHKEILQPIENAEQEHINVGESIPENVETGVENTWHEIPDYIEYHTNEITEPFEWQDYEAVGENIIYGIINGMENASGSLYITANNIAIDAYNSMISALDIGSPSKLFRNGVGKMIPAGMALGIMDNEGLVENAMTNLTNTVTDNAKQALEIPAVVKGAVIPYQATISNQTESSLKDIVDALDYNYSDKITSSDLEDIILRVIEAINGIDFYIGDEQIARHNNAGNLKLNRRYNKLSYGEAY